MKVAILTSGGDAPGMNAAVRAAARTAFSMGLEPMKVEGGYKGLIAGNISPIDRRGLGGILQRGGTVLGTQRSAEFATEEGQRRTAHRLEAATEDVPDGERARRATRVASPPGFIHSLLLRFTLDVPKIT